MPAPSQPKAGGSKAKAAGGKAAQQAKGKGKAAAQEKALTPVPLALPLDQLPPVIEEVWVQCDKCQKWRKLPSGTAGPEDDAPWYCSMNPDKERNTCESQEDTYDEDKTVVVAASDPFYGTMGVRKDPEEVRRELLAKIGLLPEPVPMPGAQQKKKGGFEAGGGYGYGGGAKQKQGQKKGAQSKGATQLQEVRNLSAACQRLIANAGSWEAPTPTGGPSAVPPPNWVWQSLAKRLPDVVQEAVFAYDALSAARCVAGHEHHSNHSQDAAAPTGPGQLAAMHSQPEQPTPMDTTDSLTTPRAAAVTNGQEDVVNQLSMLAQLAMLTAASIAMPKAKEEEQALEAAAQQAALASASQYSHLQQLNQPAAAGTPGQLQLPGAADSSMHALKQEPGASGAVGVSGHAVSNGQNGFATAGGLAGGSGLARGQSAGGSGRQGSGLGGQAGPSSQSQPVQRKLSATSSGQSQHAAPKLPPGVELLPPSAFPVKNEPRGGGGGAGAGALPPSAWPVKGSGPRGAGPSGAGGGGGGLGPRPSGGLGGGARPPSQQPNALQLAMQAGQNRSNAAAAMSQQSQPRPQSPPTAPYNTQSPYAAAPYQAPQDPYAQQGGYPPPPPQPPQAAADASAASPASALSQLLTQPADQLVSSSHLQQQLLNQFLNLSHQNPTAAASLLQQIQQSSGGQVNIGAAAAAAAAADPSHAGGAHAAMSVDGYNPHTQGQCGHAQAQYAASQAQGYGQQQIQGHAAGQYGQAVPPPQQAYGQPPQQSLAGYQVIHPDTAGGGQTLGYDLSGGHAHGTHNYYAQ